MKKVLVFVLAVLLTAGLTAPADAAMHGKGKNKGRGMGKGPGMGAAGCCMDGEHPMMMKFAALGLDDEQMKAAKAIHFKVKKETIRKQAEQEVAEIELKEILSQDPVDLKAAEAKLRQIETLRTDTHLAHIKAHEEIKALLTPEQKKKFPPMMGMGHGHGGHFGMGCGMMCDRMGVGRGRGAMHCECCMMGERGQMEGGRLPSPD